MKAIKQVFNFLVFILLSFFALLFLVVKAVYDVIKFCLLLPFVIVASMLKDKR